MQKVAVITGASKGIGRACADIFLKNDFIVINASRTNPHPFENKNYHSIKTDISKEEEIKALVDEVLQKFETVDVLINNSGFGKFANLVDTKTSDFDEMFAVNVRGLYLCTRYVLPVMVKNKSGTIINISSIAGKNGVATAAIYSASKHAVMGLSRSLMMEVRKDNIKVVAVCPGSVDTEFFDTEGANLYSTRESILSPYDVAEACFLSVKLPGRALINEIEMRPNNTQKK